jgi:hypothetical protein
MADLHTYRKLPSDPCLSEEKILAYIDGKLSVAEQHACEKHMADCAMCEDAVEGLALVEERSRIAAPLKTDGAPAEGKVVPLHQPNRKVWYAVAAVLVLILGSTFILNIISSDGVSSEDMAYNSETQTDSVSAALGEGYPDVDLETTKSDCLKNLTGELRDKQGPADSKKPYSVVVTDASGDMDGEQPLSPPMVAEAEEDFMLNERIVGDEVANGDKAIDNIQQKPEAITSKDQSGNGADDLKEESKEKNNLFDFASGVAGGTKKRAELQKSKQDSYVDDNRNDGQQNAPAGNNTGGVNQNTTVVTGTTNAEAESPKVAVSGNVASYDIVTDSIQIVTLSGVGVNSPADTAVVSDQLELSYQNGLNLLNAGQTSNAIVMFDKVLTNKEHARYEDAEFQKAKALIKGNKKEEAKTLLKAIEAKKGKHSSEATELLKTL